MPEGESLGPSALHNACKNARALLAFTGRRAPSMRGRSRPACRWLPVLTLAFVAATECFTPVRAWNERGHQLVAFIAYQHLTARARTAVHALLQLNPQFHDLLLNDVPPDATDERIKTTVFMRAATWPDFIKGAQHYS